MQIIPISLTLLEPYRVIEWHKHSQRNSPRFIRGYSFARWHRSKKDDKGKPYLTGTLVRSAIIKAAEEYLWLNNGICNDTACCNGLFDKSKAKIFRNQDAKRLRRRQTLTWDTTNAQCTEVKPCPFCLLLGRFDEADSDKRDIEAHDVNFSNFILPNHDNCFIEEIADSRVINRIDQYTGKAEDFFNIWEITDHEIWGNFEGKIELSERAKNNNALIQLIKNALVLTDKIAGSLCQIQFEEDKKAIADLKYDEDDNAEPLKIKGPPYRKAFEPLAEIVKTAFEKEDKLVHLRLLADAVKEMRSKDDNLDLPLGHKDRLGKIEDHFIWDIRIEGELMRKWIPKRFRDFDGQLLWRQYCEEFGQALFIEAKKLGENQISTQKPVGSSPCFKKPQQPECDPGKSHHGFQYEWLIVGELVSETPFFFGWADETNKQDQTNLRLLLTRDGNFRIPRSVLRGILRRDLKMVLKSGCRAEIALKHPCLCPVCSLMKNITVKDSICKYNEPPQIRHRIRIDPKRGAAADGALFDMEVGPEGTSFPFELRLRSSQNTIPDELKTVLAWWNQGLAFLSGEAGTGKGRFSLKNLKSYSWDLKSESGFEEYKNTLGGRRDKFELSGNFDCICKNDYPWREEEILLCVTSPFLTKDPVNSLLDTGGHDAICYKTACVKDGKEQETYFLKSESLRGILRTAVGRNENLLTQEHEDCTCTLCRLFGNEHEAGKVRVEDLKVQGKPKVLDRVAIDRFTGGARDRFKFDAFPLIGTPSKPLQFEGLIWVHRDLDERAKDALRLACEDIQTGLYALGGLGNSGFGWVNYLRNEPDTEIFHVQTPEVFTIAKVEQQPSEGKIYLPHSFVPFGESIVDRKNDPPSHACMDDTVYSGKIVCTLTTKTPLIIPDTSAPEIDRSNNHHSYKFFSLNGDLCIPGTEIKGMISSVFESLTNSCMRIFNEKKRLSWRMKADTDNSEIFKPGRVKKVKGKEYDFEIEEMVEIRYPFYDHYCPDEKSQQDFFERNASLKLTKNSLDNIRKERVPETVIRKLNSLTEVYYSEKKFVWDLKNKLNKEEMSQYEAIILKNTILEGEVTYYDHPTHTDRSLLCLVNPNRKYSKSNTLSQYRIIKNREKAKLEDNFMFLATPSENTDCYESKNVLKDKKNNDKFRGYLKITGPNKVEKENVYTLDLPSEPEDISCLTHNCFPRLCDATIKCTKERKEECKRIYYKTVKCEKDKGKNCKRARLIPDYSYCEKYDNKSITYNMTKRCERVFLKKEGLFQNNSSENNNILPVTIDAVLKFEVLVSEYKENAKQQKTPKVFQTILPENGTINHGDLVYFREQDGQVAEIIPVRISRKVDDELLAHKFFDYPDKDKKRCRDDLRPCVREILDSKKEKDFKKQGLKELFQHHPKGLCPACSLFGTTFYKGRVSFGFAFSKNGKPNLVKTEKDNNFIALPLLERPRATWVMPDKDKNVPGRKFYVHHHGWKEVIEDSDKKKSDKKKTVPDENNRSVQAVDKDQQFQFEVKFENLRDWELGLLVFALQLQDDLAHKLGMGKPLGFGSVKIKAEKICFVQKELGKDQMKDAALKQLKEEIWKDEKCPWGDAKHPLNKLFQMLYFQENEKMDIKVRYPKLKREKGDTEDGYMELKDKEFKPEKRQEKMTDPWTSWA